MNVYAQTPRRHYREADRLSALALYDILDTPPEQDFDDIAALASEICQAPIAVVNLIGDGRQWFKAEVGLGLRETPFETSFCGHAILEEDFMLVPDATVDERFNCNPLVTAERGLRFYAGSLLKTEDGFPIGTLCVLDFEVRSLNDQQILALKRLARQVMTLLRLRQTLATKHRSENYLRVLLDATSEGFYSIDTTGNTTLCNNAFLRMLGFERTEDAIGHTLHDVIHHSYPDGTHYAVDDCPIYACASTGRPAHVADEFFYRRDGSAFPVEYWVQPIMQEGVLQGAICTFIDVTERRAAEEALLNLNTHLEMRVTQAIIERERTEEQLRQSQKLEAIGQLTGGVAHDFNNLLTVIRGSIDLLRRPDLPEERRMRYVDAISDTVTRASRLTGQLLAFARQQTLNPTVFDAKQSVTALLDMLHTLIGSRIRITLETADEECWINADASQFDTAIVNMAVNARDAMNGEGALTIAVRRADGLPAIRNHLAAGGDFVAVSLTDTGAGIPADKLDSIFEPFFTTKPTGQGTGLGLSQVFGFTKQSGGEIQVSSEPGKGTTFTLYLPRGLPDGKSVPIAADDDTSVDGQGACVLIVEDNGDVGMFAQQTLSELGYRTILSANAAEALAMLERQASEIDAVFTDVVMPGMNGIELGQEIRRLYADLPVVLTSGYSHVLAQNGTFGFELIHKPYSVEELARVLLKVASWRHRERAR